MGSTPASRWDRCDIKRDCMFGVAPSAPLRSRSAVCFSDVVGSTRVQWSWGDCGSYMITNNKNVCELLVFRHGRRYRFFFLWADEKMHFATLFFYAIVSVSVNGGSALDFYFSGTDLLRNCKTNRHEDTNHSFFPSCTYASVPSFSGLLFLFVCTVLQQWLPDRPLAVLTNLACLVLFLSSWLAHCQCAEGFETCCFDGYSQ